MFIPLLTGVAILAIASLQMRARGFSWWEISTIALSWVLLMGADVFVDGDQTMLRMLFFQLYGVALLLLVSFGKIKP